MATVSGFLTKTFGIFSDPHYDDICGWGPGGDTIQVRKIDEFSKKILPQYFKHSNFQSFVRQLNMYDFHKTIQDPGNGEFQHMYFLKDRPDLLHLIKRKAHSRTESKAKALPISHSHQETSHTTHTEITPSHSETPVLYSDPNKRHVRSDVDRRLHMMEEQNRRIQELETQQASLASENIMLKRIVADMRHKQDDLSHRTEAVLKLLYHMFFQGGVTIPKGALSGIPEPRFLEFCKNLQIDSPLTKRNSLDDSNVLNSSYYANGSLPLLHLDTPIIDDFIIDPDGNEYPAGSSNAPGGSLRKLFSFDTVAKSVAPPTDSSLIVRSNSLEKLIEVPSLETMAPPVRKIDPPLINQNDLKPPSIPPQPSSIPFQENHEGAALSRKTAIIDHPRDNSSYEVETKEGVRSGIASNSMKRRRLGNESETPQEVPQSSIPEVYQATPLIRQASVDYSSLGDNGENIPMMRLDSMESALASFMSFDQGSGVNPNLNSNCVDRQ